MRHKSGQAKQRIATKRASEHLRQLARVGHGGPVRDASEGKGPQGRPRQRLDRRLEEVAQAVWGGYCRLQMLLRLALAVRGTVAGQRLGALEAPPRSNASLGPARGVGSGGECGLEGGGHCGLPMPLRGLRGRWDRGRGGERQGKGQSGGGADLGAHGVTEPHGGPQPPSIVVILLTVLIPRLLVLSFGGGGGAEGCVPKMARPHFPSRKFRFFFLGAQTVLASDPPSPTQQLALCPLVLARGCGAACSGHGVTAAPHKRGA